MFSRNICGPSTMHGVYVNINKGFYTVQSLKYIKFIVVEIQFTYIIKWKTENKKVGKYSYTLLCIRYRVGHYYNL